MNDVAALSCQELVELVTDYLEGTLPPEEARRFEEHVGPCSGCTAYVEQMRQTIELTGRLTLFDLGLDLEAEEALLRAFRNWKAR